MAENVSAPEQSGGDDGGFDSRIDSIMSKLGDDLPKEEEAEGGATAETPEQPTAADASAEPAEGDADKPSDTEAAEPDATAQAIEAPSSWPSDDREAFKALPQWAQERIVTREREREAYFTQKAQETSSRAREIEDRERMTQQLQQQYATELDRFRQLATTLLPDRFRDIRSDADYVRLKSEDPARASEYEGWRMAVQSAEQQRALVEQAQLAKTIAREEAMLLEKVPEFKDQEKGRAGMDAVRKGAQEYYGFSADETKLIGDHRHVLVLRDAIAYRSHLANLKAAEAKKIAPPAPKRIVRPGAPSGATPRSDRVQSLMNHARQTGRDSDRMNAVLAALDQG